MKEKRIVNLELLKAWAKGKNEPKSHLVVASGVCSETARQTLKGRCPRTAQVRNKISNAIGVDEDVLFPIVVGDAS